MLSDNPLLRSISNWFKRVFVDPAAVTLFFTLIFGFLLLRFFGNLLMPVLVSVVIAYLLNSIVLLLKRWHCPHLISVLIVYILFLGLFVFALFVLLPLLWRQLINLTLEIPDTFSTSQAWVNKFIERHPLIFADMHLQDVINFLKTQSAKVGQVVLKFFLAAIPNLIQVILYLVFVPLLVFFFLKDSTFLISGLKHYLLPKQPLVTSVWMEVKNKIGCYVRGRVVEVIIVSIVTSIVFSLLQLEYALLLGALVGISTIVPYLGATVVTIPVVAVALMEWGLTSHFIYLILAYTIIIILDGNLLVPLIFAETMNLHPVVIILALLIFGGFWGFWGVFFAIPLATLVQAVLNAWPHSGIHTSLD